MAEKAKKTATEENAVEAVEEALSIDFDEVDIGDDGEFSKLEEDLAKNADQLRVEADVEEVDLPPEEAELPEFLPDPDEDLIAQSPQNAANDEYNEELQNILYAMQQKPKGRSFFWTATLCVVWLCICAAYAYFYTLPSLAKPLSFTSVISSTNLLILTGVAFFPLLPIWAFGSMLHRAQEMRHAAGNLTTAALRLLQPEKISGDSIATVGTAIRQEMTAIGDGVERAIARAGELEYMVQKEVMELERAYGDSEIRLQRLIEDIGSERREVITHAEQLRNSIAESQSGLTSEIEIASARIEESIRTTGSTLTETLDNQGLAITSRLKDTSEGLLEILDRTGSEISNNLGTGREKLTEDLMQHTELFSSMISTSGEALATLLDGRTASFSNMSQEITEKLDIGKRAFEVAFTERSEELNMIIAATGQSVTSQLKSSTSELAEHGNRMVMDIEEKQGQFSETLATQSREFGAMAQKSAEDLADTISESGSKFENQAARVAQQIEDNISIRASDFDNQIAETAATIEEKISGRISDLQDKLDDSSEVLVSAVTESGERLVSALGSSSDTLVSSLGTSSENLVAALGMRTEVLGKVLSDRTEAIGETIADRLSGFGQTLTGHVDSAVTNLKEQTDQLEENAKLVEEVVISQTKSVEDAIKQSAIEFAQGITDNLEATTAKSEEVNEALQRTSRSFEKTVNSNLGKLSSTLEKTSTEFAESLERGNEQISAKGRHMGEEISSRMEEGVEALSARLAKETDNLSSAIEAGAENFEKTVSERTNSLGSKLNQGVHRVITTFEQKTNEAASQMESNVAELEKRLDANSGSVEKQFAAGSLVLNQNLDQGRENLLRAISETVDAASETIDGKADKLSTLLSERATHINDTLGSSLVATQRQLEDSTAELNTMLSTRTAELSDIIDNHGKPLAITIENTGEAVRSQLFDMSQIIDQQASTLFENLTKSNESLNGLIYSASENLSALQSSLSEESRSFDQTVKNSKASIEEANNAAQLVESRLADTSTNLVQNMAGIATRLEAQGALLQDATRLIDTAQSGFEGTLNSKHGLLEELSSGLVIRTDQINTSINSFAQTVQASMDDLRNFSSGTGETLATEVSTAIDDATARFSDSVEAMRGAAVTIRQELEKTREEMRKGVLELPEETAQNASAMRRIVTDQIAALKDLSSIVQRSGKMLDTSSARAPIAAAAGAPPAPIAPVAPAPTRVAQAPATAAPAASFPPDTVKPTAPAKTNFTPPAQAPANAPTANAPGTEQSDSSGWVSDLLRRASGDDGQQKQTANTPQPDPRSPDQFVESLNSLSMDIASAIDHAASVELWERYQRGETGVFTRRLYTLQGQQTFDEIHNKYNRDRDFRDAVDRYIDDFERLLKDVSRNDQGGQMAQRYLTSDTGKVYTMLAHAAGRFGRV